MNDNSILGYFTLGLGVIVIASFLTGSLGQVSDLNIDLSKSSAKGVKDWQNFYDCTDHCERNFEDCLRDNHIDICADSVDFCQHGCNGGLNK